MKHRRGFTLLELTLATAVAAVVLGAALTMFNAVDRANRKLSGRFERSADIERTRRAFQNAFSSIATSERPRPRSTGESPATSGASGAGASKVEAREDLKLSGSASGGSGNTNQPSGDSLPPPPPPRLVLGPDTGPDSDPFLSASGAQKLEIVLTTSPVPVTKREGAEDAKLAQAESDAKDKRIDPTASGGSRAIRGAFVLRAQQTKPGPDARADLVGRPMMELWWNPLPPPQDDPTAEPLPMSLSAGYPTMLTSDVLRCSWRLYREGQWMEQHSVVWRDDLPAYAEVQMDFANGQSVKWLMEIDYTSMAEVTANEPEDASGREADGKSRTGGRSVPTNKKVERE